MTKSKKSLESTLKTSKVKDPILKVINKQNFETKWGWHAVPLKGSFMAFSMIGFFISIYLIYPRSMNWGISFMLLFAIMFIASLVSMTRAPVVER